MTAGRVQFQRTDDCLHMILPSGRRLSYQSPRVKIGERGKPVVIFKELDINKRWVDCREGKGAYGGLWAENATQAVARDLLTDAMLRADAASFEIVVHVHDELVLEVPEADGKVVADKLGALMVEAPAWAEGLPIAAEARFGPRYCKTGESTAPQDKDPPSPPQDDDSPPWLDENDAKLVPPEDDGLDDDEPTTVTEIVRPEPPPSHRGTNGPEAPARAAVATVSTSEKSARRLSDESIIASFGGGLSLVRVAPRPTPVETPPARPNGGNALSLVRTTNGHDKDGYSTREQTGGRKEAEFFYHLLDETPYLRVDKMRKPDGKKYFPQYHLESGQWKSGAPSGPKIPYRLRELVGAKPRVDVYVCGGEKDADTLAALGLIATTNPGGEIKGAWTSELNAYFVGKRRVFICEDNDDTGRSHTREVAAALAKIVPDIRVIAFPELPENGDVTDWLEQGHTKEEFLARAKAAPKAEIKAAPMAFINIGAWDGAPVPEREWIIPDRVPAKHVTLFTGMGGAGKSMIMLLASAAKVLGREWLGLKLDPGPALFIDAEDDEGELHRRCAAVADHFNVSFGELESRGLYLKSLAAHDADVPENTILGTHNPKTNLVEPTDLYKSLEAAAKDIKPKLIVIASAANVFAGNENARDQVMQFLSQLRRLGLVAEGAGVVLIAHPSQAGIASGSGISGSTQWHNGPRARMVMQDVKVEGQPPDPDLRQIDFHKNNYGPISDSIFVRYANGLFLPASGIYTLDPVERAAKADAVFLALLERFTRQGQAAGPNSGTIYAPARFAEHRKLEG
jgi:RecA-family ATPase